MTSLLISVITPCLNRAEFIGEAIESVLRQDYSDVEHIIVDGGSTDGTLDILHNYPHLHVISEPDKGMYDALNKGIHLAHGEIIGWLNSDDLFTDGALGAIAGAFDRNPESEAVMGAADVFTDQDGMRQTLRSTPPIETSQLWSRLAGGPTIPNAWFLRRRVFERLGGFDSSLRYVADRSFLFRAALSGLRPLPLEQVVYRYRQHSGSATISAEDSRSPQRGRLRLRVLAEDLSMLESLLTIPELPREARRAVIRTHSDRAYRLVVTAFYHREWKQALFGLSHGWQKDALFPFTFVSLALQRLRREIPADGK